MRHVFFFIFCMLSTITLPAQDSTAKEVKKKTSEKFEITELRKYAETDKYGLTEEMPVKVGKGVKGRPYNQRAYLSLLRDEQGNPVSFERKGSCCPYKSENAMIGDYALVDAYEVKYKNKKGESKTAMIYISFYDYEEPMIPIGFTSSSIQ